MRLRRVRRVLGLSARALLAHRLRALLAAGSVAIGVASVIVTSGVGNGARAEVAKSLESAASDLVIVRPAEVKRLAARRSVRGFVTTLRREDAAAIEELPAVAALSATAETRALVKGDGTSTRARVLGTGEAYVGLRRFRVARGRWLDEADERASARVAVLGARVADSLFAGEDALGRTIRVRGIPFEVIGVLVARGATADGADEDDLVAIPLQTALRRVLNTRSLSAVFVSLRDPRGEDAIRALLRERHRLAARGAPDDFAIQGQDKMASMQRKTADSLSLLTTGLAGVALAVGGAGILALMLLSVRERTAEIGLRMAVGATPRDVLLQFLGEAALLALAGGLLGAILGSAGALATAAATGWKLSVPPAAFAVSLGTALATGLVFGAFPAWRASRVPPIEALSGR